MRGEEEATVVTLYMRMQGGMSQLMKLLQISTSNITCSPPNPRVSYRDRCGSNRGPGDQTLHAAFRVPPDGHQAVTQQGCDVVLVGMRLMGVLVHCPEQQLHTHRP